MRGATWLMAIVAFGAGRSDAQAQAMTVSPCERLVAGASVGAAINGDRNATHGTYPDKTSGGAVNIDMGLSFEAPIGRQWGARVDLGSVAWPFESQDLSGAPQVRDRVRITRVTLSAVKIPAPCAKRVRGYMGISTGGYRYRFTDDGRNVTRLGVAVFVGFDVLVSDRLAWTTEFALSAIGGPHRAPVFSNTLFVGQASAGIRVRF